MSNEIWYNTERSGSTAVCLVLRRGSELPRFLPVNIRPPPEGGLGRDEETFFREMLKIEKQYQNQIPN